MIEVGHLAAAAAARRSRGRAGSSSRRSRGPIAQRGPVSSVSSDGVGGHVVEQAERRHDLGDLGQPQQAGQADDLDGDAGPGQGVEDVLGVGVVAGQHADLGPRARRGRPGRASTSQASSSAWVAKTRAVTTPSSAASGLATSGSTWPYLS